MFKVDVHPLRIAMPWIQLAFVNLLEPGEVSDASKSAL